MSYTLSQSPILNDESPRLNSPLEWWFVQGFYEGQTSGKRYFMTSIFRHALGERFLQQNGASLLISVLNAAEEKHFYHSCIDEGLRQWMIQDGGQLLENTNVDQELAAAYIKEVAKSGPPKPITLDPELPLFSSHSFSAVWGNFSLEQQGINFKLKFLEPETQRECNFELRPLSERFDVITNNENAPGGMDYVTYPRLSLQGFVDSEEVVGEVWFDHQWGNLKWLLAQADGGRVLGWDWFGLNLDDGSDWIIMVHRDADTGEVLTSHATRWDNQAHGKQTNQLLIRPIRYWRSPKTYINHPVAWQIQIPEFGADLLFEPLVDDQEIALFGSGRAIWEGAGTVTGYVYNRPISGRGRGEFQGYGHIFKFQRYLDEMVSRIDTEIENFFPKQMSDERLISYVGESNWKHNADALTHTLTTPVWDLIARKGKRWRPAFGLLMLEALGTPSGPYQEMLCILAELTHTGSLIIDDIEDQSEIRRGSESLHIKYGVDVALNAGNTLYFLPYLLVQKHPLLNEKQRLHIYEIINLVFIQAHFGQGIDIYWSSQSTSHNLNHWLTDSLTSKILQAYEYKTAAPIAGFAKISAIIAEADEQVKKECADFARIFGVAFQILDDVRNFSTSPNWTKTPGEDLAAGKLTYVIAKAIEHLRMNDKEKIINLLTSPALRQSQESLNEGISIVTASGVLNECKKEALKMVEQSWENLELKLPSSESKILLRVLCDNMLELSYDL